MKRIAARFDALKAAGRPALVTFVTAGDPTPEASARILNGLATAGADVIELGMPFSDPSADGPAIQAASMRALEAGMTIGKTLDLVRGFRATGDAATPIILMGYFNPLLAYGLDEFCRDAADAGADGLIIVDLPPEEDGELKPAAEAAGLAVIRLATPTSDEARMRVIADGASGFIYFVSVAGITGQKAATAESVAPLVATLKSVTDLPVCIGFGIRTAEAVRAMGSVADGAVVGSAIVDVIAKNRENPALASLVHGFVSDLAQGVKISGPKEHTHELAQ